MTELPSTAQAPVCYRHPSRETYVRCTRCDRPICPDCMNVASVGHQCPECVAEGRKTVRPVRTAFGGSAAGAHGYVTITLMVINVIMFGLSVLSLKNHGQALGGSGMGGLLGGDTPLLDKLSVYGGYGNVGTRVNSHEVIGGIAQGEYYRLFTAMFMHIGILHIAMNMWALWILGRPLEAMLGPIRFGVIYVVCGIGGNVAVYLFAPEIPSAGASTAIFGLFGVFFFVLRKLNRSVAGLVPILVINLVISFAPGISLWGHLGGLATGAILGFVFAYAPQARRTQIQAGAVILMLAVFTLLTLWQTSQLAVYHG